MVSSFAMKTSLVIAIVVLNAVIINGLDLQPNIRLSFSSISKGPSIEYTILPYEFHNLAHSPLHSMIFFDVTLKATKLGTFQDLWWSIYMSSNWSTKKFKNCDYLNFSLQEQFQQPNDNHSMFHEGRKLEVANVFTADLKMKHILALHGCKNTNKYDKMHQNKIIITTYKYGKVSELTIWNTKFLIHQEMFGYVQIMNEGMNKGGTDKIKSEIFTNLTHYCHNLAGITDTEHNSNNFLNSKPTSQNQTQHTIQQRTWFKYVIPLILIVTIIFIVLITCIKRKICYCK